MTVPDILLLIVAAAAAAGLLGVLGLLVAHRLARKPGRAAVQPIAADQVIRYFKRKAAFKVTVTAQTPLPPAEIFIRLAYEPYLSRLPFLSGPLWLDDERRVGSRRTFSGTFYSVSEQVVSVVEDREITLVGTAVCTPWTIKNFAERFVISPTDVDGVHLVEWTIAGTPRWVGWLPWRLAAPLTRPIFGFVLRHILRLKAFRSPPRLDRRP